MILIKISLFFQLRCCGMTDARNYDMSVWQLRRLGPRGMAVPLSCCVQRAGLESHLNPAPLNQSRCQELQPNPEFRFVPVCHSTTIVRLTHETTCLPETISRFNNACGTDSIKR